MLNNPLIFNRKEKKDEVPGEYFQIEVLATPNDFLGPRPK